MTSLKLVLRAGPPLGAPADQEWLGDVAGKFGHSDRPRGTDNAAPCNRRSHMSTLPVTRHTKLPAFSTSQGVCRELVKTAPSQVDRVSSHDRRRR